MKRIRLTESQLNRVILNTAKRLIKESRRRGLMREFNGKRVGDIDDDYWMNQEDDVADGAQSWDLQGKAKGAMDNFEQAVQDTKGGNGMNTAELLRRADRAKIELQKALDALDNLSK